jgi:hypothetical protein
VVQQIIALKTTKSKFYVATPCAGLVSALGMASTIVTKIPYSCVRIPIWNSLETANPHVFSMRAKTKKPDMRGFGTVTFF